MRPVFKEREEETRITLPMVTRTLHNPIESLDRAAQHMRTPTEGTYDSIHLADFACRIAANVEPLGLEGSPLHRRFERLLESL